MCKTMMTDINLLSILARNSFKYTKSRKYKHLYKVSPEINTAVFEVCFEAALVVVLLYIERCW